MIDFPLPNVQEIDYLIRQLVVSEKLNLSGLGKEQLVKACQGLSRARIRRVLAVALAAKGHVNESDIDGVLEENKQAVRQTGILEFYTNNQSLKKVGGLENLKQWVRMRQDVVKRVMEQVKNGSNIVLHKSRRYTTIAIAPYHHNIKSAIAIFKLQKY